ncbi:alcohol dehydrogenase [Halobacteriales archaeon QS_1_68_17]|nr:MAG: alcohol dehydrogenase [Halobacteriales archaeon QS_1_68_17]
MPASARRIGSRDVPPPASNPTRDPTGRSRAWSSRSRSALRTRHVTQPVGRQFGTSDRPCVSPTRLAIHPIGCFILVSGLTPGVSERFRFDYRPGAILYGRGVVGELDEELGRMDRTRALLVCGSTVGASDAVMDPVTTGLGETLAGVFDRTTPAKTLGTAVAGAERAADCDADVVVGLGGGSSLDTAKLIAVLAGHDAPAPAVAREMVADGRVGLPESDLLPVVTIPTTLAGADLSAVAGVTLSLDHDGDAEAESVGLGDQRLMPVAAIYDPELFGTTPTPVLANSAMNGFDKGIEMLYGREHTAITDATARRGLRLLRRGLPTLDSATPSIEDVVRGILLVQYGLSTGSTYRASLIHAFGHGFSRRYETPQGVVHAILAPHVLRYLFERVDARRNLIAEVLEIEAEGLSRTALGEAIVDEVVALRDALGLPATLRSIEGLERSHLPTVVGDILEDSFMENVPRGLDPSREDVLGVLEEAW